MTACGTHFFTYTTRIAIGGEPPELSKQCKVQQLEKEMVESAVLAP